MTGILSDIARLHWRRTALIAGGLFFFVGILVWVPKWQVPPTGLSIQERAEVEDNARKTLAQILAGGFFLLTAYFTWRTVVATEKNVHIAQQNLTVSLEKQLTERFAKAIEQLGSESLPIRLGAIYALERIARDSERDYGPIMEVLTANVRERARWFDGKALPEPFPLDIHAILTVIGRRDRSGTTRLNLEATDLRKAELRGLNFSNVSFRNAHLEGTLLMNGNLDGADFTGAHGKGAQLHSARLQQASFFLADFSEAWLSHARLERAFMPSAKLIGAHLETADLRGATLGGANMTNAHLEGADLSGACLKSSNLSGAKGLSQLQLDAAITDHSTIVSPPFHVRAS